MSTTNRLDTQPVTQADHQVIDWLHHVVESLGGTRRVGQEAMALAVSRALENQRHLLVQAGTGTGKSLAYLIPALQRAQTSDRPVIIATATLALQAQIVAKDGPRAVEALAKHTESTPKVALLKGRANYLCKNRLHGGLASEMSTPPLVDETQFAAAGAMAETSSRLGTEVMRLREWAETTDTGDRDELTPGVSDDAWRQVSVTARECIGSSCPFVEECFSELARHEAEEADIVVTNHAMLAIAAFEGIQVLPSSEAVIIDEGHEFVDRVTSAVTGQLSASLITSVANSAQRDAGLSVTDLKAAASSVEDAFINAESGLLTPGLNQVQELAIESVRSATRTLLSELKDSNTASSSAQSADETASQAHLVRARLQEILDVCERILDQPTEEDSAPWVVWATRPQQFTPGTGWHPIDEHAAPTLYVAPLSVAGKLRHHLLEEKTCVLTSATLSIGGRFDEVAGDLGLAGTGAPPYTTLDVGSPFNYPSQGILYAAKDLPAPSFSLAERTADRLESLLRASQGGALCLFSSRRAAEDAAAEMRQRLGDKFPISCQGEATLSSLVTEFAADEQLSLFGTLSLWQGIDVPGRSLRLVTIDRIPFPRPNDPLTRARTQWVVQHGGNGFMKVSATHAAVRLAQGVGRLIRSTQDKGVVAILDPRIVTARYGSFLLKSLPGFYRTVDEELVTHALNRLANLA